MTTDIKLFDLTGEAATEIPGKATAVEKSPSEPDRAEHGIDAGDSIAQD